MTRKAAAPKGKRRPVAEDLPPIFDAVAGGRSVRSICAEMGIDQPSLQRMIDANPAFTADYEWAIEQRGEGYGDQVADIVKGVLDGTYMPDVARVAMDGLKWTAARMAPKRFGDKHEVKHSGSIGDMSPDERKNRIAELEAELLADAQRGADGAGRGESA